MTCLDVVMIVAELCRKRHNKVTKNAGITSKKLKNGANYLNINVVTVTKRKSVKRKEKRDMKTKGCRNRKPKPNRNSNEPRKKYRPRN